MAINRILFVLAAGVELAHGLAFEAPTATLFPQGWEFNGLGWTPAPTSPPDPPHELLKRGRLDGRQLASTILVGSDQTCGYLSGSAGAVYTCGDPTSTCNLLPPSGSGYGALACCARGQCYGRLFCVNSRDYYSSSACNDVCQANTFTLKCTFSNAPFCNTAVWANPRVSDVYCAASSVSSLQTIYTTYSGQTIGGTFRPLDLASSTVLSTSQSTTSFSSSSSTSTTTTTSPTIPPTPTPITDNGGGSSTPVGPIVGGVLGGLALIAAIAFGLFFVRRRNRRDKEKAAGGGAVGGGVIGDGAGGPAIDKHGSQPPPVYIPPQSEMDGASSGVNKSGVTNSHYGAGAGAGAGAVGGEPQYGPYNEPQPQDNLSPGGVSVAGEGSTYDPRRESTASPVSPRTQRASTVAGSPQLGESHIHTGYPPPPGASVNTHEIGSGAPTTYEMAGSPVSHRY